MYVGYISMGADDPFAHPIQESTEVVNNDRAYAYASWAGLTWVVPCDPCEGANLVVPGGPNYISPVQDPAPWYDENDPDTWGFCGVIGLEVSGASDSTRTANVTMSLSGVGIIGPTYMAPRTMVVRALAIAADECSLQRGLLWLRQQYSVQRNPCGGDPMTFFDCCPCVCPDDDGQPGGPCWPTLYRGLREGPFACDPEWWPATYLELKVGPPDFDEWCDWPDVYRNLRTGPPAWTCCVDACIAPYMRQFHNSRVTAGPTILRRPDMTCGALAEIEFTIVAGDPVPHSMPFTQERQLMGDPATDETIVDDDPIVLTSVDPFAVAV